jgi:peroxiredoxin
MPIAVGSQAPDFTLKSKTADGLVDVKLSANFGQKQTVILFLPVGLHRRLHAGNVRSDERTR